MKRWVFDYLMLPLFACVLGYAIFLMVQHQNRPVRPEDPPKSSNVSYRGEPVALNLSPDIKSGFRGEVHPLLHGRTKLELATHWATVGNGKYVSKMLGAELCQFFMALKPAQEKQTYTERDFSAFLPETLQSVGQVWSLNAQKVENMLCQFHPSPSLHLVAQGRRVGPDGAFAVLRAESPTHLDIVFRIHAEFDVTPRNPAGGANDNGPIEQIWLTPSYFTGQMIVSRTTGTVDYFHLGIPTDKTLNMHFTVKVRSSTNNNVDAHDIVRVDRMELLGGNSALLSKDIAWTKSITPAEAHQKLQRVFYKFMEIDWLPFEQIMTAAREQRKPIFAMVLWGSLDDQSC